MTRVVSGSGTGSGTGSGQGSKSRALAPANKMRTCQFRAARFPATMADRIKATLAEEHARAPFTPTDVRDAARRVAALAEGLDLRVVMVRGGVDVGAVELDHVWAVVEERVVDPALPLLSEEFVALVRAFVAGDIDEAALADAARAAPFEARVVGEFPASLRYVGAPFWGSRIDAGRPS